MQVTQELLDRFAEKSVQFDLRKAHKLIVGRDPKGKPRVVEGPKSLEVDGQTAFLNLQKAENQNAIRKQLGLAERKRPMSTRERLDALRTERFAAEETRIRHIVADQFRIEMDKREEARGNGKGGKGRSTKKPPANRAVSSSEAANR